MVGTKLIRLLSELSFAFPIPQSEDDDKPIKISAGQTGKGEAGTWRASCKLSQSEVLGPSAGSLRLDANGKGGTARRAA
jgi:hypothetical protein